MRLLVILLLTADAPAKQAPWEEVTRENGVTVLTRAVPGSELHETKATGTFDATPHDVWRALRDYANYPKNMPYTAETRVVGRDDANGFIYIYERLELPLISNRDYLLRIVDESDWKDGSGFLKLSWSNFDAPKGDPRYVEPKEGVVRTPINDGYWKLEPRDGGKKTWATYYVHTDPGGALPKWVVNKANSGAVPDLFSAVRKVLEAERAAGTAPRAPP